MSKDQPVPFRAGRRALGEAPGGMSVEEQANVSVQAGPTTLLADISEFQFDINDPAYLQWSKAIIIRAAYGAHHDDKAWFGGQRRDLLHEGGVKFLGIYQYIVAGQPVADQVAELRRLVGTLRKGEILVADIEEGDGSQAGRWHEWMNSVADWTGVLPWDYSGLFFADDHGLQPVNWVAAYGQPEPPVKHNLWQFTDKFNVPGVGQADCSLFHGTIDQLAALAFQGTVTPPPPPPKAPPFPYPSTDYLGVESPDPHCHSGFHTSDQPHIETWQGKMRDRGWTVAVDGHYGTESQGVCLAFQSEKGLAVDGKVGPKTWQATWTAPVT